MEPEQQSAEQKQGVERPVAGSQGSETEITPELQRALDILWEYVKGLAERAGKDAAYAEEIWRRIRKSPGLLQELAYYHDYGNFLGQYKVAGYTLTDAIVWQVDHFKLYMDRREEMNRYHSERLLLSAFETMAELEENPEKIVKKIQSESGQDAANG